MSNHPIDKLADASINLSILSLRDNIKQVLTQYLSYLDQQHPSDVYNFVLAEIHAVLIEETLKRARHNQSKAARWLGLSRGTLRKLIAEFS